MAPSPFFSPLFHWRFFTIPETLRRSAPSPDIIALKNTSHYVFPCYPSDTHRDHPVTPLLLNRKAPWPLSSVVDVLLYGGYRIGEVLRLTWRDILTEDRLLVRASKKGTASLAYLKGATSLKQSVPPSVHGSVIFPYTYSQVFHYMESRGLAIQKQNHVNRAVTHAPRNKLANEVNVIAGATTASQILNQKSPSSVRPYVTPIVPNPLTFDIYFDCWNVWAEAQSYSGYLPFWLYLKCCCFMNLGNFVYGNVLRTHYYISTFWPGGRYLLALRTPGNKYHFESIGLIDFKINDLAYPISVVGGCTL